MKMKSVQIDESAGQQLGEICAKERRTKCGYLALLIETEHQRLKLNKKTRRQTKAVA